ncbi:MAG: hypothetical protein JWO23_2061 [Solirubrobacterales bacterium]|jgi:uncharacterized membrane protein|nr:hypothetical protein [Solirubrobacterales bacterium]
MCGPAARRMRRADPYDPGMLAPATSAYDLVLALHIIAVVVAFGWTFTLPVVYIVAARVDPRSLPVLHRIEYTILRSILNPALVVLIAAGIFLASDGHHWKEFFVQWGLGVAIVIGAVVGAVLIPAAKRAEESVRRDLEGWSGGEFQAGPDYLAAVRRLNIVGSAASLLVLVTIVFMAVKP